MAETVRVEGMSCKGCVATLERAVAQAMPGANAKVSLEAGTLSVEGADVEAMRRIVESAGFDFAGVVAK